MGDPLNLFAPPIDWKYICVCIKVCEPYSDNVHCILFLIDFGNCPCPSGILEGNTFQWHFVYILASSVLV